MVAGPTSRGFDDPDTADGVQWSGDAQPAAGHTAGATWLELFYDLVFGASILLVFGALSQSTGATVYLWYSVVVIVIFALWTATTLANNRLGDDTISKRLLVLTQMLAVIIAVMTVGADGAMDDSIGVSSLGIALLSLSALWWRVRRHDPLSGPLDRIPVWSTLIGGLLLCASLAVPDRWTTTAFGIGMVIGLLPIFLTYVPRVERTYPINRNHLRERLGQFTLIVLGEAFLEIVVHFTDGALPRPAGLLLTFGIVTLIWWQYFSYIGPFQLPTQGARLVSNLLGHAMVLLGIGGAASALSGVALSPMATFDHPPTTTVGAAVALSLALGYGGLTLVAASARGGALIPLLLGTTAALTMVGVAIGSLADVPRDAGAAACAALLVIALIGSARIAARAARVSQDGGTGLGLQPADS